MHSNHFLLLGLLLFFVACTKDSMEPLPGEKGAPAPSDPLSVQEIDAVVLEKLRANQEFRWSMVTTEVAWSALVNSDSLLSIGYQPASAGDITEKMHLIDLQDPEWVAARRKVMERIVAIQNATENRQGSDDELEVYISERMPSLQNKTGKYAILAALRELPEVRYVEPLGYGQSWAAAVERSGSGCNNDPLNSLPNGDFTNFSPNGIAPWNYDNLRVKQAWNTSQGAGITVGLIDTGVSGGQDNLGSKFATGSSTGRTIEKYSTYVTCSGWWWWRNCTNAGPNDQCGHGTRMAGLIAAPLGTNTLSTMGVAYRANLISYRGTGDVIINSSIERQCVSDALYDLGARGDVDIISMSIGDVFFNGQVADAVYYAYGQGKLIFAAAGTSTWFTNWVGVIFPANLSQTVAVTGVTDRSGLKECNNCHYGSAVDFAVVMQRDSDSDRNSLTLSNQDASPINWPSYTGGSSCATATMAGIAAVVWAKNAGQSRSSVINKLKQASSEYPSRDSDFGWGKINVELATSF